MIGTNKSLFDRQIKIYNFGKLSAIFFASSEIHFAQCKTAEVDEFISELNSIYKKFKVITNN